MIGTIVNTLTILTGSILGSIIKKGIKEEYKETLFQAMGLAATGLGINAVVQNMPKSNYPVLFIVALALGSLIGTMLHIDDRFQKLTQSFFINKLIIKIRLLSNTIYLIYYLSKQYCYWSFVNFYLLPLRYYY